jgi:tol-pal system protein YbgF
VWIIPGQSLSAQALVSPALAQDTGPLQKYETTMDLLDASDYEAAELGMRQFLNLYPRHSLVPNAAYWLAETYYARQNYVKAALLFGNNYKKYGKSANKAMDNLLKLGVSLNRMNENSKACAVYTAFTNIFSEIPDSLRDILAREKTRAQCN